MTRRFTLRHGFRVELAGAPEQRIEPAPPVSGAALIGADAPGLRPKFAVEKGQEVRAGEVLFTDRKRPDIAFVAPASGRVTGIDYGPRRTLSAIRIAIGEAPPVEAAAAGDTPDALRATLLARGLWPAFQTRPFGRIPDADATPAAIFVTAIDTEPLAPDPAVVLAERMDAFHAGIAALKMLTPGPVFVCEAPGAGLAPDLPGVTAAAFEGPHPAGLAGTHIHHLFKATPARPVWTIGYQDAAAIGSLLQTGLYPAERVVALAGPRVARPRLLRTVRGAALRDLTDGQLAPSPDGRSARLFSGSVLSGREAAYLGMRNRIVTVLDAPPDGPARGLLAWLTRHTAPHGPRPIVPTEALEHAAPLGIPPVPLLRALAVGDAEASQRLGVTGLVEEDMALLSTLCTSQQDYGPLLRRVLDEIAEAV
jgi:Na+-transporting NADH:ubiquinone oxidoreductase subunit A